MTKEMGIAIVIGLIVGLFLTYGFYRARIFVAGDDAAVEVTTSPEPSPSAMGTLVLVSPQDELVQSERNITIAGSTFPNAQVVIFVNDQESLTTADISGNFSSERQLAVGSNIITVYSLDQNGDATTVERTVIVVDPDALTATSATPSAQPATN